MKCSVCQKDNEPGGWFCGFCGAPLQTLERLNAAYREVQQLSRTVTSINERLDALERRLTMTDAILQSDATSLDGAEESLAAGSAAASAAVPVPGALPQPVVEVWVAPGHDESTVTPRAEASGSGGGGGRPPSPPAGVPPPKHREWEQILGGNWLARIGVITLIVGVGFFLKFAFDNNWLGPLSRVILGVVSGLALLGGGYYWHKKYPVFGQAISGGGIAILYLSIFAAFITFELIGAIPSVLLMLIVSIGSAGIAVKYNSMALAILGILGAFAAPVLLGAAVPAGDKGAAARLGLQLLAYVLVVDVGVLVLSTFRNWRWFTFLALGGSLVFFTEWYALAGNELSLLTSEGGLTFIFLVFVGATTLHHLVRRLPAEVSDYVFMTINAVAYLGISYGLMWSELREWMGGFSLLLALFYCGIAYGAFKRSRENAMLISFAVGISIAILSIGVPVQFGRQVWTTLVWTGELVALVWLSFRFAMPELRNYGYGVLVLMAGHLLVFRSSLEAIGHSPILNERFLVYLIGIAGAYLGADILYRYRGAYSDWRIPASAFLVLANFLTLWLLSFEVWDYFGSRQAGQLLAAGRSAQQLALTALWALYAVVLLVIGIAIRSRSVRLAGLLLLALPIIKLFVYDVFALQQVYRIIAFVGLGVLLLVSAYLYQRHSRAIKGFIMSR